MARSGDRVAELPDPPLGETQTGQPQAEQSWPRPDSQRSWNWQTVGGNWSPQEPPVQANPVQANSHQSDETWERLGPPQVWSIQVQGNWQSSGPHGNAAGAPESQQNSGNYEAWRTAPDKWSGASHQAAQWSSDLELRGRSRDTNWENRKHDSAPTVFWQSAPETKWEAPERPGPRAGYISFNPWYLAMRDYADSFTFKPSLPVPAVHPSPESDLVQLMERYGMPRDPFTWMRWPDLFFPGFTALPNGWTRLWDETAHRIACYRAMDGKVHLDLHPH